MARTDVHREMKEMFGEVIGFVDLIPDQFTGSAGRPVSTHRCRPSGSSSRRSSSARPSSERVQGVDGAGRVSAGRVSATRCRFCALFHTESARLFGATDDEIEEAMHYMKLVIGWRTYINGMQVDYDELKAQVDRVVDHITATAAA